MTANKATTAVVVLAVCTAVLVAGFTLAHSAWTPASAQGTVQQYTMADVDNALAQGPVFIEFETKECGYCKQQRPISEALASDYGGKVTFFFVDAAENRALAKQFQVSGVPQMAMISWLMCSMCSTVWLGSTPRSKRWPASVEKL